MDELRKKIVFYRTVTILLSFFIVAILISDNYFNLLKMLTPKTFNINSRLIFKCPKRWLIQKERENLLIKNKQGELIYLVQVDERLKYVDKAILFQKIVNNSFYVNRKDIKGYEVWEFFLKENNFDEKQPFSINYLIFPIGLKIEYFGRVANKKQNLFLFINNLIKIKD